MTDAGFTVEFQFDRRGTRTPAQPGQLRVEENRRVMKDAYTLSLPPVTDPSVTTQRLHVNREGQDLHVDLGPADNQYEVVIPAGLTGVTVALSYVNEAGEGPADDPITLEPIPGDRTPATPGKLVIAGTRLLPDSTPDAPEVQGSPSPTPTPTDVVPILVPTPAPTDVVPEPTPTPTDVIPTPVPTDVIPTPVPTDVIPTPTPTPTDVIPTPTPTPTDVVPTPIPTDVVPEPTPTPVPEPTPTPVPTDVVPSPEPTPTPTFDPGLPTDVIPSPEPTPAGPATPDIPTGTDAGPDFPPPPGPIAT